MARNPATTYWWRRENVRAKMRIAVKKTLQRHRYPPDLTTDAVKMVLKQAEALALDFGQAA
ncbi:type I restriction enzyme endonuclease domain-containing protein [Parasedimentitalea psychrophila]|uniref:type I restriction enzyme endonuclease domain-containing protein n=1 Tax=Parasedimentitalea psychrophila TaxID=2997337 RepID=UPI0036F40D01